MSKHYCTAYCPSNQQYMKEVTFEYRNGLLRRLFRKARVRDAWISNDNTHWRSKAAGIQASDKKRVEIMTVLSAIQFSNVSLYGVLDEPRACEEIPDAGLPAPSVLVMLPSEIDFIVWLLGRDLKQSIAMLDRSKAEERGILSVKWDTYMKALKQSTSAGCVDEENPFNE